MPTNRYFVVPLKDDGMPRHSELAHAGTNENECHASAACDDGRVIMQGMFEDEDAQTIRDDDDCDELTHAQALAIRPAGDS